MSEKSVRIQRVEKELHRLVALYVQHEIPEVPGLASVTAVDVTADLRKAAVYFRLVGSDELVNESKKVLSDHRKRIQQQVADELKLRFCPVLEFRYGQVKEADPVDELLSQLGKRKTPWD